MIKKIEEAIKYIHSLPKMHKNSDFKNINLVLELLDNPHEKFESIHITGTNGKGSVSHLVNNLLLEDKLKVGMFTSPYIYKFNERIQINNQFISDNELIDLTNLILSVIQTIRKNDSNFTLVEFEFVTVLGFLYFVKEKVDIAIIEVGIGGYHDKTNVINPIISVINNVGLDHQKIIGPTIIDIAKEKSGIIKKNNQVVLGNVSEELVKIFYQKSKIENAKLIKFKKEYSVENVNKTKFGFEFDFVNRTISIKKLELQMLAKYQIENIVVAIETYYQYCELKKISFNKENVRKIVKDFRMPARMQIINKNPLVIIDGAHNQPAAQALVESLRQDFPDKKINILLATMKDKDYNSVLKTLSKVSSTIKLTTFLENRSLDYKTIKSEQLEFEFINNWKDYLNDYIQSNSDEVLVVTGSLHFVSEVLQYFA